MGALELPSEPEEADRPRQADGGGPPKPRFRELPDPDDRGRAYEAMRAHADAEAAARPDRASGPGQWALGTEERPDATDQQAEATDQQAERAGQRPDETSGRGYWAEVPRFRRLWGDHVEHWPAVERPAAADRADDLPGSHRGEGERRPERRAETADAIGLMREAEPGISADAQTIARQNTCGAWLEGFKHRLKSEDRLKEKVAEKLEAEPRMTAAQALREVADAIRYTYCFESENYTRGYYDIKERFENRGYEMYYSKNWWADAEYKGINTRWVTPDGQRFEVQFHTSESFHAKHHVTHTAYERIRNPMTSRRELRELHAFQRAVSTYVQIPDGVANIPDYRKEGF